MNIILVKEEIGENAISMQSGSNLYEIISKDILLGKEKVMLDFSGVNIFASPFFNAGIGLLLRDITIEELQERLNFDNLNPIGKQLLNLVISNAIAFYKKDKKNTDEMIDVVRTSVDDE